jgi:hypothetical protein
MLKKVKGTIGVHVFKKKQFLVDRLEFRGRHQDDLFL